MSCRSCQSVFLAKLGRCRRCMKQLAITAPLAWLLWGIGFRDTPATVGAITTLVAAIATSLLLAAHLIRARQLNAAKQRSKRP
ncbi:DUF3624 domain-containing protein [Photobacterium aquae]|uniref:DUF3624 domain-containing protein n=1 Tax=Photobacterium aquae TaxID=1195763 RepID=UPI000A016B34|nr:DUF3624 domain-containing protein [Photobacterium aquae]